MTWPPGTIGVGCGELARYTAFTMSLATTEQPDGTRLAIVTSASVVDNLNAIVRDMRPDDHWLWLVGDDHCWEPDTLTKLLDTMEHEDAQVVVPLCARRNPPWDLVIYRDETGTDENGYPIWQPYRYDELPAEGVIDVAAAGTAGMLVRRDLLDELGDPWFGSTAGTVLNEDLWFCKRATDLGARIVADTAVRIGHIGTYRVWPHLRGEVWGTYTDFAAVGDGKQSLFLAGGPRETARAA